MLVIQPIISMLGRTLYKKLQHTLLQMNQQEKCNYSLIQIEYFSVSFVFGSFTPITLNLSLEKLGNDILSGVYDNVLVVVVHVQLSQ